MIPEPAQPYFVIGVVLLLFFVIYKEYVRASLAFVLAVAIFIVTGILTPKESLSGFSNESIASIILLILITAGLRKSFDIEKFFDSIYSRCKNYHQFLLVMMAKVSALSSIVNNTPIVALLTPYVFNWGKKNNIAPSRLLIPLSYATIMGGMITVIGTSTTLVLNGFLMNQGIETLPAIQLLIGGVVVTISGILFMAGVGYRLLPNHADTLEQFQENKREYLVETHIERKSALIDRSVIEAGLRNLEGVYLVEIIRGNQTISPVDPNEYLRWEDILIFAGNTEKIVDLVKTKKGLTLPKHVNAYANGDLNIVEAVITSGSGLIGKTVKESNFRGAYDGAIVAIHRNGVRLSGKIGDIRLSAGDLLLIYSGTDFEKRVEQSRDLLIISKTRESQPISKQKKVSLLITILAALVLLLLGASLFTSLLVVFSLMAGLGMLKTQDIKREIDIGMVAILVFSLAIGIAILKTDAGSMLASSILALIPEGNTILLLAVFAVITTLLTSFVSNVGAVSIMFPVAMGLSQNLAVEGEPFFLMLAFSASAAFLTPVGYQTNIIIYGPGGYTFRDFFKVGLPVTLVYLVMAWLTISVIYFY